MKNYEVFDRLSGKKFHFSTMEAAAKKAKELKAKSNAPVIITDHRNKRFWHF